jgi:hypothetical protein
MVTESLACPVCANEVPRGRLSCPHCGSVLAAVARNYNEPATAVPGAWIPPSPSEPEPAGVAEAPAVDDWDAEPTTAAAPESADAGWLAADHAPDEPAALADTGAPPGQPSFFGWGQPPAPVTAPGPAVASATAIPDLLHGAPPEPPPAKILPRTWDPNGPTADADAARAPGGVTGRRLGVNLPSVGRIDRVKVGEAADVLVLIGSMATVIGLLVPWVALGAGGLGAWTDTWGLALPGHFIVFLFACGSLALAALPNSIGSWLRTGVIGLVLGAFVLGLVWRFAFGGANGGFGVPLTAVAGAVLLIGGLVGTLVHRHADDPPGV